MKTEPIISLISTIREKANKLIINEMHKCNIRGLFPSHGDILFALFEKDVLTMKELANIIGKDKSTVTALVDKLITLGYLNKSKDTRDNRIVLVSLTDQGKALENNFVEISAKLISTVYMDITDDEKYILVDLLSKINKNLK